MQSRPLHNLLTLMLAALLAVGAGGNARADALDGVLEVRSAYVGIDQGVYQLFARVAYPVNDDIRAALKDGLMLTFELDVVVSRDRRFWVMRRLQPHPQARADVPRRQRPLRRARGRRAQQQHAAQLRDARGGARGAGHRRCLADPLSPQIAPNREYSVSLRAGVRRGQLADTLRVLLFWTDDWHRESEWFSWSLQR